MAGVTIIAFGNGAGDVITALVAASYPGGLDYNIGATNGANFVIFLIFKISFFFKKIVFVFRGSLFNC